MLKLYYTPGTCARASHIALAEAGAGYATVAVPAELELVFEIARPEIMSVGCAGGDGCFGVDSRAAVAAAFERADAGVLGPGLMGTLDPGRYLAVLEVPGRTSTLRLSVPVMVPDDPCPATDEMVTSFIGLPEADGLGDGVGLGPRTESRGSGPPMQPLLL